MSELLPITKDMCSNPETIIRDHCIARLRLAQPQPVYTIGDRCFDGIVRRLGARIEYGLAPGMGALRVPYIDYAFGTTTARIFAGGPLMEDYVVGTVEL